MKIIKKRQIEPVEAVTFRLPKALLDKLKEVAAKNDISQQRLVTAILVKAINDRSFKLEIEG
jgi:predicted DNA binding CopG/RHH family protein